MRQAVVNVLTAASNSTQTGSAFAVPQAVSASFQVYGGNGDEAGTLKVQCSNDQPTNGSAPTNWSDITNATSSVTSGAGPAIVIANMCFAYIRVVYTRTSGGAGGTNIVVNMNYLSI